MNLQFAHIEYSMATKSIDIFNCGCDAMPKCSGCFNSELWDWNCKGISVEEVCKKVEELTNKFTTLVDRFLLVGGDPVDAYIRYPQEYTELLFKLNSLYKPIFLFTRHNIEEVPKELLRQVDYVKVGAYIPELTIDSNIQYGIKLATSNQKIIKVEDYEREL